MRTCIRIAALGGLAAIVLLNASCTSLGYYAQAVGGQSKLLMARQSVPALLAAADTDPGLKHKLALTQRVLGFVQVELGIDTKKQYTSYVSLPNNWVVQNLFVAPELSLDAHQWCYPFVGCVPYQGYFAAADATRAQQKYAADGFETFVGSVPAYSTLGWFNDPLLSSFMSWSDIQIVELLVHELTHSHVWVDGDAAFNESLASFVGERAAILWVARHGETLDGVSYRERSAAYERLQGLLQQVRTRLEQTYASNQPVEAKRQSKTLVLQGMANCYTSNRTRLGGGQYDGLMARINNAYFVSQSTYADYVPTFNVIFEQTAGRWADFFAVVRELANQSTADRAEQLAQLALSTQQPKTQSGNDEDADEIQCHTFFRHGVDAETASAKDD